MCTPKKLPKAVIVRTWMQTPRRSLLTTQMSVNTVDAGKPTKNVARSTRLGRKIDVEDCDLCVPNEDQNWSLSGLAEAQLLVEARAARSRWSRRNI